MSNRPKFKSQYENYIGGEWVAPVIENFQTVKPKINDIDRYDK